MKPGDTTRPVASMTVAACSGAGSGPGEMAATVAPLTPMLATKSKPDSGSITRPPTMAKSKGPSVSRADSSTTGTGGGSPGGAGSSVTVAVVEPGDSGADGSASPSGPGSPSAVLRDRRRRRTATLVTPKPSARSRRRRANDPPAGLGSFTTGKPNGAP